MKTKLLKKLRRMVKSEKRIWIWMSPIDRRNEILEEVYKIRKRKNIKPKASYHDYDKAQQKQALIDMMRGDEELGLYMGCMPKDYVHHSHIIKIIELIRDSFGGSTIVYTQGSCTKFAMILKYLFPDGEILRDHCHTIFEYNGRCYDINGYAEKTEHHKPIVDWGLLRAYDWMTSRYEL